MSSSPPTSQRPRHQRPLLVAVQICDKQKRNGQIIQQIRLSVLEKYAAATCHLIEPDHVQAHPVRHPSQTALFCTAGCSSCSTPPPSHCAPASCSAFARGPSPSPTCRPCGGRSRAGPSGVPGSMRSCTMSCASKCSPRRRRARPFVSSSRRSCCSWTMRRRRASCRRFAGMRGPRGLVCEEDCGGVWLVGWFAGCLAR